MPYQAVPYAGNNRRMSDLIREQGRSRAEAELRRGDISAQMWSNIGNTIASTVGNIAQQQRDAPIRAREEESARLDLASKRKAVEDKATLASAQSSTLPPEQVKAQLMQLGRGDLVPIYEQANNDLEASRLKLKDLKSTVQAAEADYFGGMAAAIKRAKFDPIAIEWALGEAERDGHDVGQLKQQLQQNPQALPQIVDHLIGQSPTQQKRQREEAELALKTETEKRMAAQAAQAAADREADNKRADATAAEAARHNKAMEARPVAGAQPSFQAKEVIGDDGKPTMANFDSRSGGYTETATGKPILHPKPVPSAMEQMDSRKFEKAGPILSSIEELSEKINTQAGLLAKMAGGAAKVQAKSNYNDDVAEYQALVSGFTPLVARSLGHTGVLTQQDVDSVKELFPKPGDSKTLRDRKISRIKTIIGQLEAIEGSGGAPPQAPKAGDGGGWTIVGGVRIREKP